MAIPNDNDNRTKQRSHSFDLRTTKKVSRHTDRRPQRFKKQKKTTNTNTSPQKSQNPQPINPLSTIHSNPHHTNITNKIHANPKPRPANPARATFQHKLSTVIIITRSWHRLCYCQANLQPRETSNHARFVSQFQRDLFCRILYIRHGYPNPGKALETNCLTSPAREARPAGRRSRLAGAVAGEDSAGLHTGSGALARRRI